MAAKKSAKLANRPAPAPAAPVATAAPVRKDAYGTEVPAAGTPEFEAWHAANLQSQRTDTGSSEVAAGNLVRGGDTLSAGIDAAGAGAKSGFQTFVAGAAGGSPLAPGAQTRAPTVQQNLAGVSAAGGVGGGGFNSALTSAAPARPTAPVPTVASQLGGFDMGGGVRTAPSKVELGANNAADALGPAPRVDQGLADRRLGEYQEALGMSREVIDRLLNGPSTAKAIGARSLENQLAIARSARGGPGAVQDAMNAAQQQAPELQAQASQQAAAEELQRVTAAGSVASNFAQASLGARGQDVDIAKKNTDAGIAIKGMITQLTGTQLELDQRNQEMLGQMARDMAAMDFDWAQLDAQQQNAALDRYLTQYGIDANIKAQIMAQAQAGKMTTKDWINAGVGVLGAAAGVAAAGIAKP